METLRGYFSGEGDATRNLVESEKLNKSLHYKSEREISFEIFLTQSQKFFNIYKKEGEEMSNKAKVRFLFQKVQHTGLRSSIDGLKYSQATGTPILYTMDEDHFSTTTSELPEYIAKKARNVLGVQVGNGTKGSDGIYNKDG